MTAAGTGGAGPFGGATGAAGGRAGTGGSARGGSGGPTVGGGGGAAALGCAGKTYKLKLCEDFDSGTVGALPAGWTTFKGYGTSRPTDQAVATRFFSDSIEVNALTFTGGDHEMQPAYMALILGATYYQTDPLTGPFTMWIDDLAIDDTQIGCQ